MDKMLTGKVAVITGSGQGIGKTCAETFLKNGAKVCLSDVVVDRLQATYEEFKLQYGAANVHQIPCDVTDKTQVEDLFKGTVDTFGAIDIVFNNAGVGIYKDWENVIQINQVCLSDVVVDRLQATYEEFKLQYGAANVHQIPCDVTDKTQVEGG
ncbi:15-hydroxyprostaglandin dehydrogenase [NAD(+)]-like [Magallana gigas]|uniref:15-hydroxyprostaglandin dehydrogenase [NAD(+)]-like n=1 Tax=Magallana gigas TaxID=29159 RepID=UPI00333E7D9A